MCGDSKEYWTATKGLWVKSSIGEKHKRRPAKGKDCRPLIDRGAALKLLRRHKAGRAKHPPHVVRERPMVVGVEVHHGELARRKVVDQAAVIEVVCDPAKRCKLLVESIDGVEAVDKNWRREVAEALE